MNTLHKAALADFAGFLATLDETVRNKVLENMQNLDYEAIKKMSGEELEKIVSKSNLTYWAFHPLKP